MAYDDRQEQYLVVWQEETSEIRGRWVLPGGTLLDSSDIDLSTTSHSYRYWPRMAMRDVDGDTFWLHGDDPSASSGQAWAARR